MICDLSDLVNQSLNQDSIYYSIDWIVTGYRICVLLTISIPHVIYLFCSIRNLLLLILITEVLLNSVICYWVLLMLNLAFASISLGLQSWEFKLAMRANRVVLEISNLTIAIISWSNKQSVEMVRFLYVIVFASMLLYAFCM